MTDKEILEKAIKKALANGWLDVDKTRPINIQINLDDNEEYDYAISVHGWDKVFNAWTVRDLLFNHEFAKALFGTEQDYLSHPEGDCTIDASGGSVWDVWIQGPAWQIHLQQMVLEEEPLKYVERFIGGGE